MNPHVLRRWLYKSSGLSLTTLAHPVYLLKRHHIWLLPPLHSTLVNGGTIWDVSDRGYRAVRGSLCNGLGKNGVREKDKDKRERYDQHKGLHNEQYA